MSNGSSTSTHKTFILVKALWFTSMLSMPHQQHERLFGLHL